MIMVDIDRILKKLSHDNNDWPLRGPSSTHTDRGGGPKGTQSRDPCWGPPVKNIRNRLGSPTPQLGVPGTPGDPTR